MSFVKSTFLGLLLGLALAGCEADNKQNNVVSRFDVRDKVLADVEKACIPNLGNLSKAEATFDRMGFNSVTKNAGTSTYLDFHNHIVAQVDDFKVTRSSGGKNVDSIKGQSCSVFSKFLTKNHAKEIVKLLHTNYLANKTRGYGTNSTHNLLQYSYPEAYSGKDFSVSAVSQFVEYDQPNELQQPDSEGRKVRIKGYTLVGIEVVEYD